MVTAGEVTLREETFARAGSDDEKLRMASSKFKLMSSSDVTTVTHHGSHRYATFLANYALKE